MTLIAFGFNVSPVGDHGSTIRTAAGDKIKEVLDRSLSLQVLFAGWASLLLGKGHVLAGCTSIGDKSLILSPFYS